MAEPSTPEKREPLTEGTLKYRRTVLALSVAAILIGWLPNVDLTKLPVVSALNGNNESAQRTALWLLLGALAYHWAVYAYRSWRD